MTVFEGTGKDWAISQGLAKPGKGRMSKEAHIALAKALEEGLILKPVEKDAPKRERVVKPETGPVEKAEKPKKDNEDDAYSAFADAFMRYPLDTEFVGTDSEGKRVVVNARAACKNARHSIAGCGVCPSDVHTALSPSGEWTEVALARTN